MGNTINERFHGFDKRQCWELGKDWAILLHFAYYTNDYNNYTHAVGYYN